MPNKNTFTIKPIKRIIEKYAYGIIIDPFANNSRIAAITNDLDPYYDTNYHMDAFDFLKIFDKLLSYLLPYENKFIDIQEKQLLVDFNNTYILPEKMVADNQHQNYYSFRTILNYYCLFIKATPKLLQSDVKCDEENKSNNIIKNIIEIALNINILEININYRQFIGDNNTYNLDALHTYMEKLY